MKKFGLAAIALTAGLFFTLGTNADAAGVGYINYAKVQDNYSFAQAAIKEIDAIFKEGFIIAARHKSKGYIIKVLSRKLCKLS